MYFTPRGKDQREQQILDSKTYQKFLEIVISGDKIEEFFHHSGIKRIAVAPNNHLAQCLVRVLKDTDIEVLCIMDKMCIKQNNTSIYQTPIEPYVNNKLKEADSVVITSNYYYNEIVDSLLEAQVSLKNIIGLNTILFALERLEK